MSNCFRIMHRETGLFSTGGMDPNWSKSGKTWKTFAQLKTHLRLYQTAYSNIRPIPAEWQVVEYELRAVGTMNAYEVLPTPPRNEGGKIYRCPSR